MMKQLVFASVSLWSICALEMIGRVKADPPTSRRQFEQLLQGPWTQAFADPCTDRWQERWFLDGEKAEVSNSADGMTIDTANGFAVLWTQQEFFGDLRIEYEFQRADSNNQGVNIIYIQATGDGEDGHIEDITQWSDRRRTAAMSDYFQNMHTYHISYAAFPNSGTKPTDYIRGRRYLPLENQGLRGTELTGEVHNVGIFEDHQWIRVTIIKRDKDLWVDFDHPEKGSILCHMENKDKPAITHGRVGLRLMPGRVSRFRNIRIDEAGTVSSPAKRD